MPAFSASEEQVSFAAVLSGQYELEREIGRGGMGVVYLARDLRLDRMVAIKTLPPALSGDATIRERFLREARTAARLNHPNIVPIHRADEVSGQVFFVMGFIDGDSLAQRLVKGPLSPREALPILREVAAALGYAHKHGIIHRDVKTENILLDSVTGRAMVTDFGIAHVAAAAPLTATGQVLGTVYYLSPEQVADAPVDARSDIYALGVVGFAMLTGRFPFDAKVASAVLMQHVFKPAPALTSVAPHVPPSLGVIIDRCLAKSADDRFQSCADLEAALERVRAEANAVSVTAPASASPLLSSTEGQEVLRRAAELNEMTSARSAPPVPVRQRDKVADARREEGFKTSVLRDAAAEAGIDPKHVEQALAERGLRPSAVQRGDRRPANIVFDLTALPTRFGGNPSELLYEMVVQGEVSEDDYDVLINTLTHFSERDGVSAAAASVGRTLTWNGRTHKKRELSVAITPRDGRTTLRVMERLKEPINSIYGAIIGAGGIGVGGAFFGNFMAHSVSWNRSGAVGFGLMVWFLIAALSYLTARAASDTYSEKRQAKAKELLEALAAQARELAKPTK